jgi:hypothetical protein
MRFEFDYYRKLTLFESLISLSFSLFCFLIGFGFSAFSEFLEVANNFRESNYEIVSMTDASPENRTGTETIGNERGRDS